PTQAASTNVDGAGQTLPGTLKVKSTAGFATAGTINVTGVGSPCTYTSIDETHFKGVAGCSGTPLDTAIVTGTSAQQKAAADNGNPADDNSKTADGDQSKSAALAVVVLISTTQAYIAPAYISPADALLTRTIATSGGNDTIHAGSKNNASTVADAGNVKFSPDAPTLTPSTVGGSLPDGTYYYKVTATFASGESLPSAETKVELTGGGGSGRVVVSWTAVDGATGYKVYRGDATGNETLLKIVLGGGTTTYNDTNTGPAGDGTPDGTTKPPTTDT